MGDETQVDPTLTPHVHGPVEAASRSNRVLSYPSTGHAGPTVVLIGSIHGNEPAGARAIENVMKRLEDRKLPVKGRLLGVAGNLAAIAAGRRFVVRDLNRGWVKRDIEALLQRDGASDTVEDREQRELLAIVAPLLRESKAPVVFLDLHSTSADGPPFCCMADVLRNRPVALALPVPLILGIEEALDGSMLGWLCDHGHVGIAVEGGQHDDPRTVKHHEAAIWLTLVTAGSLQASDVEDLAEHRAVLAAAAAGLPRVVEIRRRHEILPGDGFEMAPGFQSFTRIQRGQRLARDRFGPITAAESGVVLMPRYQAQGDDGFFIAKPVSRFWLQVSAWLRRLHIDRLAPLLPGVHRDPAQADHVLVNPRVASFQVVNVFHLLGYRRVRSHTGGFLAFSRRRPDFRGLETDPHELRPPS